MRLWPCKPLRFLANLLLIPCCLSIECFASAQSHEPEGQLAAGDQRTISLAGSWRFALDPDGVGVEQRWFATTLDDAVQLPGTTDENHKGVKTDEQRIDRLSRVWYWKGPAWYQREVSIPGSWAGKRVVIYFERTKNTRVWVDQTFCGWDDTLSAPQVFDATRALAPGRHTITVLVDNARLPPVGPSHAVDERTQTNWNGILGKMELRDREKKLLDIIRGLLLKPRFLLLDEPTAGLPEDQTRLVMDLIKRKSEQEDLSIVIIEHDLALIWEICEYVHFMADGIIAEQGPPEQIRSSATVAAKYLGHSDE